MGKKLYVGNLSFTINDESLKELFAAHGNVETAQVIMDKFSGRSKGFGFIEMENDDEANKAIEELNGTALNSREMVVNEAKPKKNNY